MVAVDAAGQEHTYPCSHVISSMPLGELCRAMDPPVDTAHARTRRPSCTTAITSPSRSWSTQKHSFSDNWIYVHDPDVEVGRVQNYGSWSPFMVKEGRTCLGLEFFVNEGDEMWTKADADLIAQGTRELCHLEADRRSVGGAGRLRRADAEGVSGVRRVLPGNVSTLRKWLEANTPNVFPCGRNGMHKYNNQDHSMFTAMLSVENILGAHHDVWSVNVEAEYHEESTGGTGRRNRPRRAGAPAAGARRAAAEARAAGSKADATGRE